MSRLGLAVKAFWDTLTEANGKTLTVTCPNCKMATLTTSGIVHSSDEIPVVSGDSKHACPVCGHEVTIVYTTTGDLYHVDDHIEV